MEISAKMRDLLLGNTIDETRTDFNIGEHADGYSTINGICIV
jgi:hypothetical protein